MHYSRGLFYFRKYVYVYFLMLFLSLIFLKFLRISDKCVIHKEHAYLRALGGVVYSPLAAKNIMLSDAIIIAKYNFIKNIDQSILLFHSWGIVRNKNVVKKLFKNRLEEIFSSGFRRRVGDFQAAYYNSIKAQNFISLPRVLIDQFNCRIRLINGLKYNKNRQIISGSSILSKFIDAQAGLNKQLKDNFLSNFPRDVAMLSSGTLIGSQSYLPTPLKQDLITTGLIHVVVASGYNLTLISSYVEKFLKLFLSKRASLIVSLLTVWWYVVLAGMNPSILRAGWMASLVILTTMTGRPHGQLRGVLFSVLIMLAIQVDLLTNISFQLSVSSTLGVILINNWQSNLETDNDGMGNKKGIWKSVTNTVKENAVTTFGANLFTLPIILFWFGRLSLVSIFANTALLWLIPLIMIFSFYFLIMVHIHVFLAYPLIFLVFACSKLFLLGVHFFARIPYASVSNLYFNPMHIFVYYAVLFLICKFNFAKRKKKKMSVLYVGHEFSST